MLVQVGAVSPVRVFHARFIPRLLVIWVVGHFRRAWHLRGGNEELLTVKRGTVCVIDVIDVVREIRTRTGCR